MVRHSYDFLKNICIWKAQGGTWAVLGIIPKAFCILTMSSTTKYKTLRLYRHMPNSRLGRQKQLDLCKFKVTQIYTNKTFLEKKKKNLNYFERQFPFSLQNQPRIALNFKPRISKRQDYRSLFSSLGMATVFSFDKLLI